MSHFEKKFLIYCVSVIRQSSSTRLKSDPKKMHSHQSGQSYVLRMLQIIFKYLAATIHDTYASHPLVRTQRSSKNLRIFFKSDPITLHCVIWWSIAPWRGPIDKRSSSHTRLSDQKKNVIDPLWISNSELLEITWAMSHDVSALFSDQTLVGR